MRRIPWILFLFLTGVAQAQQPAPAPASTPSSSSSSSQRIDSPSEIDKLKDSCGAFKIPDCAEELFTGTPVHIAIGSIAPQNGFGLGLAYLGHKTTDNWRDSWDADAVASINGSWRAGVYLKLVHTPNNGIGVGYGTPPPMKDNLLDLPEHSVINLYAQAISLNTLTFFGEGPNSTLAGRSFFGMTQTIVGGSAVKPDLYEKLNLGVYAEINGRFVSLRPNTGQPSPTIGALYTEATAPGLTTQPGTLQLGEGVRMRPAFMDDLIRLNYNFAYQQFLTPSNSTFTFQRLTADLSHEIAIYRKTTRSFLPRDNNGPDECAVATDDQHPECPKPYVRNREGSINLRVFSALSMTPGGDIVPFYFQPTLGGSDINGNASLPSYQDFRFRAPNVLLFQENFEHSLFSLPLGFTLGVDEGKVGLTRGDLSSSPWIHSFHTGLTLRAGGFPQVYLLFAWGGNEGTHTIANVNTSLMGGSTRPSLF